MFAKTGTDHPASAKPPESKRGKVAIQFVIMKDGTIAGMRLDGTSGDVAFDRAAWGGITLSSPFPPLPPEFKGNYVALRFSFYCNPGPVDIKPTVKQDLNSNSRKPDAVSEQKRDLTISPAGSVKVVVGATQQFSVSAGPVVWSIVGEQCAKTDCGIVSAEGMYAAPAKKPQPAEFSIRATDAGAPLKCASVRVVIVEVSSTK